MLVMNNTLFREVLFTWMEYLSIKYSFLNVSPSIPVLPVNKLILVGSRANSSSAQAFSMSFQPFSRE